MSVLSVQAVSRRFADRVLFSEVSFRLAGGDRAGLVGPNGTGKTTLLRIAAGVDAPDGGSVALARGARVALLRQELLIEATPGTVREHAAGAASHLRELEAELRDLEATLGTADDAALEHYSDVQHRFAHAGGYDFDSLVDRVLAGLGLDALAARTVATLSGGERTRLGLARILLDDPDVLLLDEPTNHLDLAAIEWLESFLVERRMTALVASHDRWFLDRVTSRTLALEPSASPDAPADFRLAEYRGGYSHYARQRAEREASLGRAAARQATEIARTEDFIRRYGAGQRAKEARGRAKKLARVERIAAPGRARSHGWRLEAAHLASETVLESTPLTIGYGAPLLRTPALRVGRGARVAIVGPNGAGKTTLVRSLVGDLTPLDGHVTSAPTARVALLAQAQADLAGERSVLDALRDASGQDEQAARDLLARFLFRGEEVFRPVGVLSGGERSRLALARLAAREANLLVLDEPTNHLDVAAREALELVLEEYQGTMLVVSHDRYFIDRLATELWVIASGSLSRFEGNWSAYQRARVAAQAGTATARATAQAGPAAARTAARGSAGTPPARAARGRGEAARPPAHAPRASADIEARIAAMEDQVKALQARIEEIAASGNYLETRRIGREYEDLDASLRVLYEEWAAARGDDT
ncbi:MAG: ABC-F family ATP-binding cassette domain-containing protein [Candidatus Limnocylindria bacterium]